MAVNPTSTSSHPPQRGSVPMLVGCCVAILAVALTVRMWAHGDDRGKQSLTEPGGDPSSHAFQQLGTPASAALPDPSDAIDFIVDGATMASEKLRSACNAMSGQTEATVADLDAWLRYPRTKWSIGWYVARMTEKVRAEVFVRNIYLNPDDFPLAEEVVAQLDIILQNFVAPAIRRHYEATMSAVTHDIDDANVALEWQPAAMTKVKARAPSGGLVDKEVLSLPTDGAMMVYRGSADGGLLQVPQSSLPTLRKIKEARYFFICEVGAGIIDWFRVLGVCPESSVPTLLGEVYAEAERSLR
jgi:hypothetical protein